MHETYRGARRWKRDRQAIGIVIWISFLSAALACVLVFALYDAEILFADLGLSRDAGYALGFFFFWGLGAATSAATAWLIRTAPKA